MLLGGAAAGAYIATKSAAAACVGAAVCAAGGTAAYGLFLDGRIRFRQVVDAATIVAVCLAGGAVGQGIAQLERLLPRTHLSVLAVGPIEETAKLAVPLALYLWGNRRFRDPRVGLAIVLASAAGFAIGESVAYAFRATGGHLSGGETPTAVAVFATTVLKPPLDPFLHMSITGIVGAVAWRQWHLSGGLALTPRVCGAVALAMALHSLNDITVLAVPATAFALPVAIYLIFKHAARRLVPPDASSDVPPGWRPAHLPVDLGDEDAGPAVSEAAATGEGPTG